MTANDDASKLLTLIQRAAEGDEAALGEILEEHRDWLKIAANKELHGQLAARIDASDIVQQTFLSACNQIRKFDGGTTAEFAAWLGRIHERNIQDAIRQHVAADKRTVQREQPNDVGGAAAHDASTPSQRVMRNESKAELAQYLDLLPEDQREAVRLRHLEGKSLAQLAEHFGRSKDAVAALLKRGVENLRAKAREK